MIALRSNITRKVLSLFFLNPQETFYVNELARRLGLDKRNLVKKLHELESVGILRSERKGNLKLYGLNRKFPLYREYKKIFLKTLGVEAKLREIMKETEGVKEAYIYGSYARDAMSLHSDLDLIVIGSCEIKTLEKKINYVQNEINREINVVFMSEDEFKRRMETKDPFLSSVFKQRIIRLI